MKIQILSDLHLEIERPNAPRGKEFYHYEIPVQAETLALLGDIGSTIHDQLFDWLKIQLNKFKLVLFLSGNHEHYGSSIVDSETRLKSFEKAVTTDPSISGKFVLLNRTRYDISPSLTVLACTLWSSLNPSDLDILSWCLTDFNRVKGLDPAAFTALHQQDLAWLNGAVAEIALNEPHRRIIILTHHAPTLTGTGDPKFVGQPTSSAFATELTNQPCWKPEIVAIWAFGHTHWCCDQEVRGIRVYSNQRGYGHAGERYNPEKVIDIL
ncbi:Metallo-dependent phosphatase-like protein [Abortiporus biennis]